MNITPAPPPIVSIPDPLDNKSKNLREEDRHRRVVDEPKESQSTPATRQSLDAEQKRQVEELKQRDRQVHAHEAAHKNRAGRYAGAAQFTFQIGPDGKRYAVGGEVSIDLSPVPNNPQATLQKAQTIQAAALAPQDPSGQDHRVAAKARLMANEARLELHKEALKSYQQEERPNPLHFKA